MAQIRSPRRFAYLAAHSKWLKRVRKQNLGALILLREVQGRRLQRLRMIAGQTQKELANILGITVGLYKLIEDGQRPLHSEHVSLLCMWWDITPDYLLVLPGADDAPAPRIVSTKQFWTEVGRAVQSVEPRGGTDSDLDKQG